MFIFSYIYELHQVIMKTKEQGVFQVVLDQGVRITSVGVCLFILAFLPLFPSTLASGLHRQLQVYIVFAALTLKMRKTILFLVPLFGSALWFLP